MAKYVDADKLRLEIKNMGLFETAKFIKTFPSEDVSPVIHAQWTRKRTQEHDGELYCSNCEWTPEVMGCTTLGDLQLADVYFCPHCGAKMDEEEGQR